MTAFLIIGTIGVVLLIVSLVLGDVFEGAFQGLGSDLFTGAAAAGFLGAFGFVAALVEGGTESTAIAIVSGLVAGVAVGAAAGWLTNRLRRGGDEANVRTASLVGRTATVMNPIPDAGYGEISMVASGHITKLNARATAPVPAGATVVITGVLSATAVLVEALPS